MSIRTTDLQSAYAVRSGLGSSLVASLKRFRCPDGGVVVHFEPLLRQGFYVVDATQLGQGTVVKATGFTKNFDLQVDYGPVFPLRRVGYSLLLLPEKPMESRRNDDRLLYFDTEFMNKGSHRRPKSHLSDMVDSEIAMIWRYNLPDIKQIRFYVDPSVPLRWREYFKSLWRKMWISASVFARKGWRTMEIWRKSTRK